MARPLKYYVVFSLTERTTIVRGIAAARKLHAGSRGFKTQLEAEEWAAWWRYEHPPSTERKEMGQ